MKTKSVKAVTPQPAEPFPGFDSIAESVKHLAPANVWYIDPNRAFSVLFAQIFVSDSPNYELKPGFVGATRSNWTYHTAMAMAQAAKFMNLTCKFENSGQARCGYRNTRGEA
jgi:hypothetical protein